MAVGSEVVVMTGAPLTVMVRVTVSVLETPLASVTTTVKVSLVALVATVPEMTPVELSRVRPLGRVPSIVQVSAPVPPVAVRVAV